MKNIKNLIQMKQNMAKNVISPVTIANFEVFSILIRKNLSIVLWLKLRYKRKARWKSKENFDEHKNNSL
jgi:hypothetical protein